MNGDCAINSVLFSLELPFSILPHPLPPTASLEGIAGLPPWLELETEVEATADLEYCKQICFHNCLLGPPELRAGSS